ncbi:MAG: hypothetical protein DRJ38_05415 [Thermoprotei archaeon]|nr:MAG: hypothetical protein DRJ38_05415 [Thermoprotei archaeon]
MSLDAGYSYIVIDGYTLTVNPIVYKDPRADKKAVPVVTLTETITQHWTIKQSDKVISMSWKNLPKADLDILIAKYEADYSSYTFVDIYGESWTVVITDLNWDRRTTIDGDGFSVSMTLSVVSKP